MSANCKLPEGFGTCWMPSLERATVTPAVQAGVGVSDWTTVFQVHLVCSGALEIIGGPPAVKLPATATPKPLLVASEVPAVSV